MPTEMQRKALSLMSDEKPVGGATFGAAMGFVRKCGVPLTGQGLGRVSRGFLSSLERAGLVALYADRNARCDMFKITSKGLEAYFDDVQWSNKRPSGGSANARSKN